jgi:hypothetical protein
MGKLPWSVAHNVSWSWSALVAMEATSAPLVPRYDLPRCSTVQLQQHPQLYYFSFNYYIYYTTFLQAYIGMPAQKFLIYRVHSVSNEIILWNHQIQFLRFHYILTRWKLRIVVRIKLGLWSILPINWHLCWQYDRLIAQYITVKCSLWFELDKYAVIRSSLGRNSCTIT